MESVRDAGAGVTEVRVGDRVAYAGGPLGAYSEVRCLPADRLLKLPEAIDCRSGAAMIVHDEEDRFAPHKDSLRAAEDGRTRLVSTRGLGHGRILASPPVFAAFDQLTQPRGTA